MRKVWIFLFAALLFLIISPPVSAQCSCDITASDACASKSTCGKITWDTCVDNLGGNVTSSCSSGATSFRCFASGNSNCVSDTSGGFNYQCSACNTGSTGGNNTIEIPIPQQGYTDIGKFIGNVLTVLFGIAILVVLFMLVWGAYEWITSGGDKEAVAKARGRILNALIGLAVLAVAFAIAAVAANFLGFDITQIIIPKPE